MDTEVDKDVEDKNDSFKVPSLPLPMALPVIRKVNENEEETIVDKSETNEDQKCV